ncbi:MAG: hypothetical protein LBH94_02865 [Deltaproteobacteria bacterium]|jgi:hypothetical protein|nr:hypothetical protein [Deltaproteobacteria bacterium]
MPEQELCFPHSWELADTPAQREEVYSFRYRHYFNQLPEAEWLDHDKGRVYSPHDEHCVHLVARNAEGKMIAVSTAGRADAANLPTEWTQMLQLDRLRPLDLAKILISSRLVELPACRGTPLFLLLFKYAARLFTAQGYGYTIHYSPPAVVALYERLGYRSYGNGFTLASGLYRIPMILVVADAAHLGRVRSMFSDAIRGLVPTGDVSLAYKLLPELLSPPLCAHNAPDALALVRGLCRNNDAEQIIPNEAARLICRAALPHLRAGDAPVHPGDKPLLWFVLSGACEVADKTGARQIVQAGYGINAYSGCSFVVLEDADILIFGNAEPFDGAQSIVPAERFWKELLAARKKAHR